MAGDNLRTRPREAVRMARCYLEVPAWNLFRRLCSDRRVSRSRLGQLARQAIASNCGKLLQGSAQERNHIPGQYRPAAVALANLALTGLARTTDPICHHSNARSAFFSIA